MVVKRKTTKPKSRSSNDTPLYLLDMERYGRPPIHVCIYGDPTAGKTHFISTMPWPINYHCFDAVGKDMPMWLKRLGCTVSPDLGVDKWGTQYRDVFDKKTGKLRVRIEYYRDPIIDEPEAFARYIARLSHLKKEYHLWRTMALDSVSRMLLNARKYSQYDLQVDVKDPRLWHGDAVDLGEEILCQQLPALECNVVIATHITRTKIEAEGGMVRAPRAKGRIESDLAADWPECYRIYSDYNKEGKRVRYLQTQPDVKWQAGTQLGLPDPILASYQSIMKHAQF